ncbi:copper chaperone PCu(A)C, partial [Acinetobacter baumannii]
PIKSVAVPAATEVAFKPGGRHAMLFNVNPSVLPGSNVQLLLTVADNTRLSVTAPVIAAGDPAP